MMSWSKRSIRDIGLIKVFLFISATDSVGGWHTAARISGSGGPKKTAGGHEITQVSRAGNSGLNLYIFKASDKVRRINFNWHHLHYFFTNPTFDHLLELSLWDDSNKWSNVGFFEEIGIFKKKYASYLGPCILCGNYKMLWTNVDALIH